MRAGVSLLESIELGMEELVGLRDRQGYREQVAGRCQRFSADAALSEKRLDNVQSFLLGCYKCFNLRIT